MAVMWTTGPTFSIQELQQLQSETLIINGDHDDIDLNHILGMYQAIPKAQLFIVPGSSHFLHQEKPALLNKVLLDFLGEG